ncbi:MAG: hypothetical protein HY907_18655 [Deltaproteobacteria bacterium]|nr:hypothetical protein [Deltaproteobacteria bacterium]
MAGFNRVMALVRATVLSGLVGVLAGGVLVPGCVTESGDPARAPAGAGDEIPPEIATATFAEESCCADDSPCQDGLWCNGRETCNCWGECEAADPSINVCVDGDPCTDDTCDETADACPHELVFGPGCACTSDAFCDDGDACTVDVCDPGTLTCTYGTLDCNDGNICTDETCNPATGCVYVNNSNVCDDGQYCTVGDTCGGGACVGAARVCPNLDGLACTPDVCNEATDACQWSIAPGYCVIGGVCYLSGATNPANACQSCQPAVSTGAWSAKPNGTPCNDGQFCTLTDSCNAGICTGVGVRCPVTGCVTGCNEVTDTCTFAALGTSCSNGQWCDGPEVCNATGTCLPGSNPCTLACEGCNEVLDLCDVVVGCRIGGACYAVGATNPANQCQWCDPATSRTAWTNKPAGTGCNDGLYCTLTDTCNAGACTGAGARCPVSGCVGGCNEVTDACTPAPVGTPCAGAAGTCSTAGLCDGTLVCPGAGYRPAGFPCRSVAPGGCDVAESCTGASFDCPPDGFLGAATVCRAAAGTCDVAENCTGASAVCPGDVLRPLGFACNNGLFCDGADTCNGAGACLGGAMPCNDGLWCTTDACNEVSDLCTASLNAGTCLIAGVCYNNGDLNPANLCQRCWTATSTSAWSPAPGPLNDTCAGSVNIPMGGSVDGDTMCANADYVNSAGAAIPCGSSATAADVVYNYSFTTPTDYQLYHYRTSERSSGATPHPDPYVYARSTCADGSGGAEWRCNNDCSTGFVGTNYSGTACAGLPGNSGVVVVNPVPVGFAQTTSVMSDGGGAGRGTITTAVARENHNNNSCAGTSAYHASPNIFPGTQPAAAQQVRWRGNNTGYADVAGIAPSCGGGGGGGPCGGPFSGSGSGGNSGAVCLATYSFNAIAGNTYIISTCGSYGGDPYVRLSGCCAGSNDDSCGLGSQISCVATCTGPVNICASSYSSSFASWNYTVAGTCSGGGGGPVDAEATFRVSTAATPPIHFYYDELAILYDGNAATSPFDAVIQLLGPDASLASCTDAANASCSSYSGWGPASVVLGSAGVARDYWVALGAVSGARGQYELTAQPAVAQFTGQHQYFPTLRPASSGGGNFDLQCTRIDFVPTGAAGAGYTATWSVLPGCAWVAAPGGAAGNVVWERLTVPPNFDDCSVNYPIGFNFRWGEAFYTRMVVDSNGRIRLSNNPADCSGRCFDYWCADYTANVAELYQTYEPTLAVLWTDLIMCSDWGFGTCSGTMGQISRQIAPIVAPTGETITAAVVSWENNGYYNGWGGDVDFQAILYIDGRFSFIYRNITGNSGWFDSSYGIVGLSGTTNVIGGAVNFR